VHVCTASACSAAILDGVSEVPILRLSPGIESDGHLIAFTRRAIFLSTNFGASFRRIEVPGAREPGVITDVELPAGRVWTRGTVFATKKVAIAAGGPPSHEMYRSFDWGVNWEPIPAIWRRRDGTVDTLGALSAIGTESGRIVIAFYGSGLGCSADRGSDWSRRCPPEW